MVKNPPANAGGTGDMGSIPGAGSSAGVCNDFIVGTFYYYCG